MSFRNPSRPIILAIAFVAVAIRVSADTMPPDLVDYLGIASTSSPRIVSANLAAKAAVYDADASRLSFRAPALNAAIGQSENPIDAPFGSFGFSSPANALSVQAGIEAPLAAGVYGAAGVRQQTYRNNGETDGDSNTSAGARLRIPLWRDRGFAANDVEVRELEETSLSQAADAASVLLDEYTSIAKSYSRFLFVIADAAEIANALDRAETLVKDATDRAELQDVATYQVFPARFESAIRREELSSAKTQIVLTEGNLRNAIGIDSLPLPSGETIEDAGSILGNWAKSITELDTSALVANEAAEECPEIIAARHLAQARIESCSSAAEAAKPNFDIVVGAGWTSEEDADSGNEAGYGAALVFSMPLSRDGDKRRILAAETRAEAANADLAATILAARVRHENAIAAFDGARSRLAMAEESVEQARLSLEAENERFSIGDGSSRNVLDAQKDLTSATRQKLSVAHDVIDSYLDLCRAAGIPPMH